MDRWKTALVGLGHSVTLPVTDTGRDGIGEPGRPWEVRWCARLQ